MYTRKNDSLLKFANCEGLSDFRRCLILVGKDCNAELIETHAKQGSKGCELSAEDDRRTKRMIYTEFKVNVTTTRREDE